MTELATSSYNVGDVATPWTFGPVSRTDIVRYAGASGDFNPIHHDEPFAVRAGFDSVFSMGMFQAGLVARFATEWLGASNIRRFGVRFRDQVWPGDVLTFTGAITAIESIDGGTGVTVELACARHAGPIAVTGSATFEFVR
jgi:acyl dehydratase